MNVLEKILEEVEEYEKRKCSGESLSAFESGIGRACLEAKEIIRSHMDDIPDNNWIPVEERLPEEHDSIFARFKGTDKWNKAMFEKISDEVNATIEYEDGSRKTTTSYTLDGVWKIEKEQRIVKQKVTAWQPLPEAYKGGTR